MIDNKYIDISNRLKQFFKNVTSDLATIRYVLTYNVNHKSFTDIITVEAKNIDSIWRFDFTNFFGTDFSKYEKELRSNRSKLEKEAERISDSIAAADKIAIELENQSK